MSHFLTSACLTVNVQEAKDVFDLRSRRDWRGPKLRSCDGKEKGQRYLAGWVRAFLIVDCLAVAESGDRVAG